MGNIPAFSPCEQEELKMKEKLINLAQRAVQTKSYSDEEEKIAKVFLDEMIALNFDEAFIDKTGNVVGRMGSGSTVIQFDGHMDTVLAEDEENWQQPPFSGNIADGWLWGRGSVDMKSAISAAIYAAAKARDEGWLEGKTVYVTGTVCEEYCDGENLKHLYTETGIKPDYCVICEPSDNIITLGHKGKAQIRITTHGISAHGSAPEKGKNAVYEMAEIIQRVEKLNESLFAKGDPHGTIVLSDISSVEASLNAVPTECTIYLDRRLAIGESLEDVKQEMDGLIEGKSASWDVGTLRHTSWTGEELVYEPMHEPWEIAKDHPLTQALIASCTEIQGHSQEEFDFWDFGTNAVTPISMGIPCIGFGCGEYKLAHMVDEKVKVSKIEECMEVYASLIKHI